MRKIAIIIFICAAGVSPLLYAGGQKCVEKPGIKATAFKKAIQLAQKVLDYIEQHQERAVIVARVGSDQANRGIKYTHAGLLLRDHAKGKWIFTHLLNKCGSPSSEIFDEGLVNFFLDDPHKYEALVLVPDKILQDRLAEVLKSNMPRQLHQSTYSILANPFRTEFQNSNGWVLEMVATAQADRGRVNSRTEAQKVLKRMGYKPALMRLSMKERIGARVVEGNVSLSDHTWGERRAGFKWASVKSIVNYLKSTDQVIEIKELSL